MVVELPLGLAVLVLLLGLAAAAAAAAPVSVLPPLVLLVAPAVVLLVAAGAFFFLSQRQQLVPAAGGGRDRWQVAGSRKIVSTASTWQRPRQEAPGCCMPCRLHLLRAGLLPTPQW